MSVIHVENLTKYYGKTLALDKVDLEVEQGEVFGFIGPNGAGKTTTLRILLGLLHKNAGHVSVLGADPWRDAVALHRRLAYVPGDVSLWPNLSGGEVIDLLGRLRGGFDQSRRDELERTVREHGFKGGLINGHIQGRYLDDELFWPILERAEELKVPLYLHPTPPQQAVITASYTGNFGRGDCRAPRPGAGTSKLRSTYCASSLAEHSTDTRACS